MTEISDLSLVLIEHILSFLPIPKLIQVSTVCKLWHSIISSSSFSNHLHHINNQPWLMVHAIIHDSPHENPTFAFDPSSNSWFLLPTIPSPQHHDREVSLFYDFFNNNGLMSITNRQYLYTSIFHPLWRAVPLPNTPQNRRLALFNDGSKCIVISGKSRLVEDDMVIDMEMFDPLSQSWDLGPPLPRKLISSYPGCSSSTTLFKGKLYVLNIYNGYVSSCDLHQKVWSDVLTLRPPGVDKVFKFRLIAGREHLILVGDCLLAHLRFIKLWKVDEKTMEFVEISTMPRGLYRSMFDNDSQFFNCFGMGDLVYILKGNNCKNTCVCVISGESGKCVWKRLPQLPVHMMNYRFCKVFTFCSTVTLHGILGDKELKSHG